MKRAYETPKVEVLGHMEELTGSGWLVIMDALGWGLIG